MAKKPTFGEEGETTQTSVEPEVLPKKKKSKRAGYMTDKGLVREPRHMQAGTKKGFKRDAHLTKAKSPQCFIDASGKSIADLKACIRYCFILERKGEIEFPILVKNIRRGTDILPYENRLRMLKILVEDIRAVTGLSLIYFGQVVVFQEFTATPRGVLKEINLDKYETEEPNSEMNNTDDKTVQSIKDLISDHFELAVEPMLDDIKSEVVASRADMSRLQTSLGGTNRQIGSLETQMNENFETLKAMVLDLKK